MSKPEKRVIKITVTEEGVETKIKNMHEHEALGLIEMTKNSLLYNMREERKADRMDGIMAQMLEEMGDEE